MGYDNEKYDIVHETSLGLINSADTIGNVVGRFATFANAKIIEVTALRHGLGTADEAGFDIYHGTTSVDTLLLGTAAVGSILRASLTDIDFTSTDTLNLVAITSDTTLSAFVSVTWQERFTGNS